jgi:quaternary ammonium compound-resistance protein SugE
MAIVTSTSSAWAVVLLSGALEVVFSVAMKLSDGYTRPTASVVSGAAAILSVWLMSLTLKALPLGTAYAVWAGFGAAGTAVVGMVWFSEPADLARIGCIGAVVAGIVGLQWLGPH